MQHVSQNYDFITLKAKTEFPTYPKGCSSYYLGKPYTEFIVTNELKIKAKAGVVCSDDGKSFKIFDHNVCKQKI